MKTGTLLALGLGAGVVALVAMTRKAHAAVAPPQPPGMDPNLPPFPIPPLPNLPPIPPIPPIPPLPGPTPPTQIRQGSQVFVAPSFLRNTYLGQQYGLPPDASAVLMIVDEIPSAQFFHGRALGYRTQSNPNSIVYYGVPVGLQNVSTGAIVQILS